MKVPLLLFSLMQFTIAASAQDSLLKSKPVQESYPVLKLVTIQKEYYGDSDYKILSKGDEHKGEGEFSGERLKISAAFPVYTKNKIVLSAGATYTRTSFSYYSKETPDALYNKGETVKNDFDALFSAGYQSKLFNKPVFYNATVMMGSTNFFNIKKLSGSLSSSLILKQNASTLSVIGLYVNLDRSVILPFFPMYSYWHKFSDSFWEVDLVLPQRLIARRSDVLGGWLSTGVELTNNSFFLKQDADGQNRAGNYEWISNEINSYIGYEHMVGKSFLLGIKGGYRNTLTTRLIKVNDNFDDYKSKTKIGSTFFNMNVSYVIPNSKLAKPKKR
ncbi:hypothetical protein HDE68_005270 [Pedobacter cryoconitis]|uniref:Outer membrane protein beta-barrel domain-containing protein n=1 Tax=Pedobacter cryoconitis TaxID=188932 RepID=A0A7W8ZSD5_9SPHI|nr:hypothetical protein [Pedobacter cryoconitis]MBB5639327.1 hypothetical protein [Pedobacter cryoconitis]